MTPIDEIVPGFKLNGQTIFAKNQPEYIPLPAHVQPDGTVTIRWKLSWKERILIFLTGSLWHQILTFNSPLQPQKLITSCPIMAHHGYDEEI